MKYESQIKTRVFKEEAWVSTKTCNFDEEMWFSNLNLQSRWRKVSIRFRLTFSIMKCESQSITYAFNGEM